MTQQADHDPARVDQGRELNFILAPVPEPEYARMRERLGTVELSVKEPVYQAGRPIENVYFPLTAILSMVAETDGEQVEVATIGREGMAGLPAFLGVFTSPNDVFAQVPGTALRLPAQHFRTFLATDGALHRQLYRYIQAMIMQLSQNVACNRLHKTEERAARWLLMTADRVGSLQFSLTQEFLAQMLGVRRATVSLTAGQLHSAGLISYSRGVITIDDRASLEAAACECYGILREEFDRLRRPA
jgi:CRP-like cAMP-binding protein